MVPSSCLQSNASVKVQSQGGAPFPWEQHVGWWCLCCLDEWIDLQLLAAKPRLAAPCTRCRQGAVCCTQTAYHAAGSLHVHMSGLHKRSPAPAVL